MGRQIEWDEIGYSDNLNGMKLRESMPGNEWEDKLHELHLGM